MCLTHLALAIVEILAGNIGVTGNIILLKDARLQLCCIKHGNDYEHL